MDGVIVINMIFLCDVVVGLQYVEEMGGLSGLVMIDMSLEVICKLNKVFDCVIFIIGVGGIDLFEVV